uniref:Uncharacterized protein n=1 Tax=Arundo donax TaxID=35708 RepID=A0A0A9E911_ARUDO
MRRRSLHRRHHSHDPANPRTPSRSPYSSSPAALAPLSRASSPPPRRHSPPPSLVRRAFTGGLPTADLHIPCPSSIVPNNSAILGPRSAARPPQERSSRSSFRCVSTGGHTNSDLLLRPLLL